MSVGATKHCKTTRASIHIIIYTKSVRNELKTNNYAINRAYFATTAKHGFTCVGTNKTPYPNCWSVCSATFDFVWPSKGGNIRRASDFVSSIVPSENATLLYPVDQICNIIPSCLCCLSRPSKTHKSPVNSFGLSSLF